MAQNMQGAWPLTKTNIEARDSATWYTVPAGSITAYLLLSQFC